MKNYNEIGAGLQTSGEWFRQHAARATDERVAEECNKVENLIEGAAALLSQGRQEERDHPRPTWHAIILTCQQRKVLLRDTLARCLSAMQASNRVVSEVVRDTDAIECLGRSIESPQERQAVASAYILDRFLHSGYRADYLVFLEDDLIFNLNFWHNLNHWAPIVRREVTLASLYNPNIRERSRNDAEHWFIADPEAVYGSQAMILSRECAAYILKHWDEVPGMQDIKFSRLAARMGKPLYYHTPSLVQHVGRSSVWTSENRFHETTDFNLEWRA